MYEAFYIALSLSSPLYFSLSNDRFRDCEEGEESAVALFSFSNFLVGLESN